MTRFHMSIILFCTIFSGVLFSKLYLHLGMEGLALRYLSVLISAYLVFFVLIKVWLIYLTSIRNPFRDILELTDISLQLGNSSPSPGEIFLGKGGDFGGGGTGTSIDWELATDTLEAASSSAESAVDSVDSVGKEAVKAAGKTLSEFTDEGTVLLIPIILLFLAIFGTGAYLIYEAPVILSEAAFEFLLASGLFKGAKRMENPDWMGSIFRATWKPLVITAMVVAVSAWMISRHCPEATTLKDVYNICIKK